MVARQIYAAIVLRAGNHMKILAINYFSKLLNATINEDTLIRLSSGQSSRAHAWLKANNFSFDEQSFRNGFSVNQLLGFAGNGPLASSNLPPEQVGYSVELEKVSIETPASVGIDIQSIAELFPAGLSDDPKADPELLGIYTIKELSYAQSRPDPVQTLTGLFAAKEAILKCAKKEINLIDIEILPDRTGRPVVDGFIVSISHSVDNAVAIAMPATFRKKQDEIVVEKHISSSNEIEEAGSGNRIKNAFDFLMPMIVIILATIEIVRFLS